VFGKPIVAKHLNEEIWQRHELKNDNKKGCLVKDNLKVK
jgi:hypothetical protein